MGHKVVFISYPIRGRLYSSTRRADIRTVRSILSSICSKNYRRIREGKDEIIPIAPYLLHADCAEDIGNARARFVGWEHNPPQELRVYGTHVCHAMRLEIARMRVCDLPVIYQTPKVEQQTFLIAAE